MSRAKELEFATEQLLRIKGFKFIRVDNYRCFRCGQVQNSRATGWPDFFCYYPRLLAVECKTGRGVLSIEQKEIKHCLELAGVEYIVVRDNIDNLMKAI